MELVAVHKCYVRINWKCVSEIQLNEICEKETIYCILFFVQNDIEEISIETKVFATVWLPFDVKVSFNLINVLAFGTHVVVSFQECYKNVVAYYSYAVLWILAT